MAPTHRIDRYSTDTAVGRENRGFDADKTYPLPEGPTLEPVAPPTEPPYKAYLERTRAKQQ
jgi:hypothetical protein